MIADWTRITSDARLTRSISARSILTPGATGAAWTAATVAAIGASGAIAATSAGMAIENGADAVGAGRLAGAAGAAGAARPTAARNCETGASVTSAAKGLAAET